MLSVVRPESPSETCYPAHAPAWDQSKYPIFSVTARKQNQNIDTCLECAGISNRTILVTRTLIHFIHHNQVHQVKLLLKQNMRSAATGNEVQKRQNRHKTRLNSRHRVEQRLI